PWLHLPLGLTSQLAIIVVVSFLAIFSAVSGVAKGIRRLSEINILVSILLLLAILIMGPTLYLLKLMPASLWDYLSNVIPMGFWTAEKARNQAWQGAWTVFYWGWWLAWMPFVALFVARISKGRTVREFILGVLLVPSAMVLAWMTIFGGTALYQEVQQGTDINQIVNTDYSLGMVALIQGLHVPALETPLYIVVSFLLFSWLITSLDSATLVICHILHVDHLNSMKIFWGFILGTVTATLLLMGGIGALQAASIIVGLPMAFLALLMIVACYRFIHQG
ncbi:MAG: BCCT family transporter, partial [Pseudomonadales bacterium]|nr:BCCT family transporter [Pseudomonadales bacterium]